MSLIHLRTSVGYVRFDDVTVVLDTAADRYWQFTGSTAFALDWVTGKRSGPALPSAIERLRALHLLDSGPADDAGRLRRPSPPERSALDERGASAVANPLLAIEVVATALWSILALKLRPLAGLLDPPRGRRVAPEGLSAVDLARAYRRYRAWLPTKPVCLPDSLALRRILARRGHHPDLVFGVSAYPFAAHCWLQSGDLVLDDVLDHVHLFTAIHVA